MQDRKKNQKSMHGVQISSFNTQKIFNKLFYRYFKLVVVQF